MLVEVVGIEQITASPEFQYTQHPCSPPPWTLGCPPRMSPNVHPHFLRMATCLLLALAGLFPVSNVPAADDPVLEKYFVANAAYNRKSW